MRTTTLILHALSLVASADAGPLRNQSWRRAQALRIPRQAESGSERVASNSTESASPSLPATITTTTDAECSDIPTLSATSSLSSLLTSIVFSESSTFVTPMITVNPTSSSSERPLSGGLGSSTSSGTLLHSAVELSLTSTTTGRPVVTSFRQDPDASSTLSSLTAPESSDLLSSISATTGTLILGTGSGQVSSTSGFFLNSTATATTLGSATITGLPSSAALSSSSSSTAPVVTGSPNPDIPTVLEPPPPATTTVSPDVYQRNIEEARGYNKIFATLTEQTACSQGQVACIAGGVATCAEGGTWDIAPCPELGTACLAMPMNTTDGAVLGCTDVTLAKQVLESIPDALLPGSSSTVSATASTTLSTSTGSSADALPTASSTGRRTRTSIVTVTSGIETVTVTVDPSTTAESSVPSTLSLSQSPSSETSTTSSSDTAVIQPITRTAVIVVGTETATITFTIDPNIHPTALPPSPDESTTSQGPPFHKSPPGSNFTVPSIVFTTVPHSTTTSSTTTSLSSSTSTRESLVVIPIESTTATTTTSATSVETPTETPTETEMEPPVSTTTTTMTSTPGSANGAVDGPVSVTVTQLVTVTEKERVTTTDTATVTTTVRLGSVVVVDSIMTR
ncbi:hypothetical protein MYCTH_2308758 [Thermothelomyces thermophilus ATCC 42464]|uniref:Carbohydrate-binding module family 19 domain-containing protein n=1 Tax=Thermothelomyces thermophilus (strain ATCC 42464 / BCRC 31852 / DSM 1799) TaxID=573729 RepID=G2QK87_THET4|nr:uncharacterized protein MYCTH_2308758 [Thermothelomyces thermophilus ATCC 42464]AEO59993.1 hypothetical protein MYCTH_2308758 [Thermothelomyces thermophilus ATCC 42464]